MAEPLIQFRNVSKRFGDLTVLDAVSFVINKGEVTAIIGKSGVGKSVVLKHIIGLMKSDSGDILFDKINITTASREDRPSAEGPYWLSIPKCCIV